jgi:hypothetical protein
MHVPHKGIKPIIRMSIEEDVRIQVTLAAENLGIPVDVVLKQGKWSEDTFNRDGQDWLEVHFATKTFLWIKRANVDDFDHLGKRKLATWSGGPRDGQEIVARNGEIVWDGPLGVLVHDQLVVWRDVGESARASWALMTPEERSEFRHEIEDDAEVLVSHDAEIAPPAYVPAEIEPDSPMATVIDDWAMLTHPRPL